LGLAALSITACGGGSSDEDKIVEAIERAETTSDPGNCTELQTRRFDEQNTDEQGKAAVKACEEEEKQGKAQAKGVRASNVAVDGEKATAEVEFEGGPLGSQALEVALVEEGGSWKLDQVEGFARYDGKALEEAFEKKFAEEPAGLSKKQAHCIARRIGSASQAKAEELFFSGSSEPIIKLAEGCA